MTLIADAALFEHPELAGEGGEVAVCSNGAAFKLAPPSGDELPRRAFDPGANTYQAPAEDGSKVSVVVELPKPQ